MFTYTLPNPLDDFSDHLKWSHDITIAKRGMIKVGQKIIPKKEREELWKVINIIKTRNRVKIKKPLNKLHKKTSSPKIKIIFSGFESSRR